MSGATSVRRRMLAVGSRSLAGITIQTSARSTQAPKTMRSTRELNGFERATRASGAQHRPVLFLVVEDSARAAHDTREWVIVDVDGEARFLAQQEVEPANQRAAAGHHDAAVHDVARELGRGDLQRPTHRIHDLLNRLLDRFANLARVHAHRLRNAGDEIAALHFHLTLVADRGRTADLNLD